MGKLGESVIFEQNRGCTQILYFGAFGHGFRAKSPRFCTFYRLVNLLKFPRLSLKIPRFNDRAGSSPTSGTKSDKVEPYCSSFGQAASACLSFTENDRSPT